MKKLIVLVCVVAMMAIMALGAGTALGGGINQDVCSQVPQETGVVYNTLCAAWPGPAVP